MRIILFNAVFTSLSNLTNKQKIHYFVLVSVRTFSGLLDVGGIASVGVLAAIATSGLNGGNRKQFLGITLPTVSPEVLVLLAGSALVFFVLKSAISIWVTRSTAIYLADLESTLSQEIAESILGKDLISKQRYSRAEMSWILLDSSSHAFSGILLNFSSVIADGFLVAVVTVVFCFVNFGAALASITYLIIVVGLIQYWLHRRLLKAAEESTTGNIKANQLIEDMSSTFKEMSVYRVRDFFFSSYEQSRVSVSRSNASMRYLGGLPRQLMETALIFGIVLFIGWQLSTNSLEGAMGVLGVFLAGGLRIVGSLIPLQGSLSNIKSESTEAQAAQNALILARKDVPPPHENNPGLIIDTEIHKEIMTFSDVSFIYPGATHNVISNLNFSVDTGQRVALIGPSGAGKTTLADLALGLINPTSGKINIHSSSRGTEHENISYVPQQPGIISGTFKSNIALGVDFESVDLRHLEEVIKIVGLEDLVHSWEFGLETIIGSGAMQLSGGQTQRVGLARALYFKPNILLLDEATSSLDAASEAFISDAIMNLPREVTVIVIAHRLSTIQAADKVFLLEEGKITASGTFAELRATHPLIEEYVALMSFDSPGS